MKTAIGVFWLTILAGAMALPQTTAPATKKAPAPKTASVTGTTASSTSKTGKSAPKSTTKSSSKSISKSGKSASKKGGPAVARRYGQMAPTPDRYKEIQSALVQKGYLQGEPTGVWDSDSVDAMKRYQEDQEMAPTGKLTASALIGLGLGPKPDAGAAVSAPSVSVTAPTASPAAPVTTADPKPL